MEFIKASTKYTRIYPLPYFARILKTTKIKIII
jgi:hypothetical protein